MENFRPITKAEADFLFKRNKDNHSHKSVLLEDKHYGLKVTVVTKDGKTFVCTERDTLKIDLGGGGWRWREDWIEPELFPAPEFSLEDMELAAVIVAEINGK